MPVEKEEVDLLTAEERLALAEAVLRHQRADATDVQAAYGWARTMRRMGRMLDAVLSGKMGLRIEDGEVVDFYEPANCSVAAEEDARVDYSS